jgi:hypothetical protein
MNSDCCQFEDAVTAALANGWWTDDLRRHAAVCPQCSELQLVWKELAYAAELDGYLMPMPSAGLIWRHAQLTVRRERMERAIAAIEIMRKIAIAATLIALGVFVWLWKPDISPVYWSAVLTGAGLLLSSGIVLYGWARGRI